MVNFDIRLPPGTKIVRFSAAHVLIMNFDPWQKLVNEAWSDFFKWAKMAEGVGPSYTVLDDSRPVMCFGVIQLWPGVVEAWMLRDEGVDQRKISLARGAKLFFDDIGIKLQLKRCQMTVDCRNVPAQKFAKWLKFKEEGVLKSYAPDGADFLMMSRMYNGIS